MVKPISPLSQPIPSEPQITSADLIALWLRQQGSEHTRRAYERDIHRLFRFAAKPLDQLTALDLARFADHLLGSGLAPISRARTLTAVRSLLRFGYRSGVLAIDIADKVQLPR